MLMRHGRVPLGPHGAPRRAARARALAWRLLTFLLLGYLLVDLSDPLVPGAFEFDLLASVDAIQVDRIPAAALLTDASPCAIEMIDTVPLVVPSVAPRTVRIDPFRRRARDRVSTIDIPSSGEAG
jgi:hypothetical protein